MEKLTMCRICLVEDKSMHSIIHTNLQATYERLTLMPFQTKDCRPIQICHTCCGRLRNSYHLQIRCIESEELFTQMLEHEKIKQTAKHPDANDDHTSDDQLNLGSKEVSDDVSDAKIGNNYDLTVDPLGMIDTIQVKVENLEGVPCIEDAEGNYSIPSMLQSEDNMLVGTVKTLVQQTQSMKLIKRNGPLCKKRNAAVMKESRRKLNNSSKIATDIKCKKILEMKAAKRFIKTEVKMYNSDKVIQPSQNVFICDLCKKSFSYKHVLRDHIIRLHTTLKPYECDTCQKCFITKSELNNHIRIHTGEKPYKCNICKTHFGQWQYLNSHMRIHTGEKPYKCDICQKCFGSKRNLNDHIRIHTGEKPYKCVICVKSFSQRQHLNGHMRVHTGLKPFECYACEKCFSQNAQLKRHVRTHTGEKPFKCEMCGQCFSRKRDLSSHRFMHTGDKPYKCELCEKHFSLKQHLSMHMHIHTGEKLFKCNICEKSFRQRGTLTSHMRIHSGEKPYKCDVCDKCFSQKTPLKTHMRIHTDEKPYKCDICNKCYGYKIGLLKHNRIHIDKSYK